MSGPLAIAAFIWQWVSLPPMESDKTQKPQRSVLRLFSVAIVPTGLLACGLFFMGQFALFTYVRLFLESVTRVGPSDLSLILLAIGVAGFVGTMIVSTFLNTIFYKTLIMIRCLWQRLPVRYCWSDTISGLLPFYSACGATCDSCANGVVDMDSTRVTRRCRDGGGLMVAVIQLSIALGSTAGGLVFDSLGWRSAFGLSGLLLLGAVAMTCATSRQNRKAQ